MKPPAIRPVVGSAIVGLIAFVVYQFTLAPSVDFIDSGELATVAHTFGIAHPTGYPLFTLIAGLFAHLPIAATVIGRLNEMAALFTALGAASLMLLLVELYSHWSAVHNAVSTAKGKDKKATVAPFSSREPSLVVLIAMLSALAAAFSSTWWSQSTGIEVYPLHLFMISTVLLFFFRMLRREESSSVSRDGFVFSLLLGLSFANHMTTILLAPAVIYAFFARYGWGVGQQRVIRLAMPFVLGLLVYLYLPIRASQFPLMDWGHPADIGRFFKHITGGQYKIWMFTGGGAAAVNWAYFWGRVPLEFTIAGGILALVGIYGQWKNGITQGVRPLFFTLLLFFGCLLYSINYSIHDIDSYFLLAYLAVAMWIGSSLQFIERTTRVGTGLPLILAIGVGLIALEIGLNRSDVDESGNHMVENYTNNVLLNLPPNAIIFSTQWDFWVSGAFYFQIVEKVRPDVLVIDKAMLRDRPWYFEHLKQRAPQVIARVESEMNTFVHYLDQFDRGDLSAQEALPNAYQNFTQALVERNLDHPIYLTQEMVDQRDPLFAPKMKIVPAGIAYRFLPADSVLHVSVPKLAWSDANYQKRSYYTDQSRVLQIEPMVSYAARIRQLDPQLALEYLDAALKLRPNATASLSNLAARDKEVAESTNEAFVQVEQLRTEILRATSH